MHPIADLRKWAGLTTGDGSHDETLRTIEAGVVGLVERATNRLFATPPAPRTELLHGPELEGSGGGLTLEDPQPPQWITLREEVYPTLSGTFTVAPGTTAVTGTSTKALTELSGDPPSAVRFGGGDPVLLASVESDTELTLAEEHEAGFTDVTASAELISLETRQAGWLDWVALDPLRFEVDRRRVYSLDSEFYPGHRTVRVMYRHGFPEGQAPGDVGLLVLDMVKHGFVHSRKRRRSRSVGATGAFNITWASFGEEAQGFMERAKLLRRPFTYDGR